MKYTKKQREDAALICQIAASNGAVGYETQVSLGVGDIAYGLAAEAFGNVPFRYPRVPNDPREWGEAESWIRCGWSRPGDEEEFS